MERKGKKNRHSFCQNLVLNLRYGGRLGYCGISSRCGFIPGQNAQSKTLTKPSMYSWYTRSPPLLASHIGPPSPRISFTHTIDHSRGLPTLHHTNYFTPKHSQSHFVLNFIYCTLLRTKSCFLFGLLSYTSTNLR